MNPMNRQELIELARAAKSEVEERNALKTLADMLPQLEAQEREAQTRAQVQTYYEQTKAKVEKGVEILKPEAAAWQAEFFRLCDQLTAHIAAGAELQGRLLDLGRMMRDACNQKAAVEGASMTEELFFDSGMEAAWKEIGGMDSALDLLPETLDLNSSAGQILRLYRFRQISARAVPALLSR